MQSNMDPNLQMAMAIQSAIVQGKKPIFQQPERIMECLQDAKRYYAEFILCDSPQKLESWFEEYWALFELTIGLYAESIKKFTTHSSGSDPVYLEAQKEYGLVMTHLLSVDEARRNMIKGKGRGRGRK